MSFEKMLYPNFTHTQVSRLLFMYSSAIWSSANRTSEYRVFFYLPTVCAERQKMLESASIHVLEFKDF